MKRSDRNHVASGAGLFLLVGVWFAFEYLRPQDYLESLAAFRPALILLVLSFLVWLMYGDKSILNDRLIRLVAVFIVVGSTSVFWARNNFWPFQHNLALISYLIGGVLPFIAFVQTPDRMRRFFTWWLLFHLMIAVASVFRDGRGSGAFMGDENDLALTMVMALPYAYFIAQSPTRAPTVRLLALAAGAAMVLAVIVSFSRGGFLGLLAVGLALVWYSRNRVRNLLVMGTAGAMLLFAVSATYWDEMSSITDEQESTRVQRIYYWSRGMEMFFDNPLFGVGTGNFPWRVEEYERKDPRFVPRRRYSGGRVSHSLYFTVLPEYGIVGTGVFALLVIGLWRRLSAVRLFLGQAAPSRDRDDLLSMTRAANASLLAFLVSGAFLSVLYYPHLWYILGFALALERVARTTVAAQAVEASGTPGSVRDSSRSRAIPSKGRDPAADTPT